MNKLLFLVAIPLLLLIAPAAAHGQTTNSTETETNSLLKQILDQLKLNTQLSQDNSQVLAIKADIIKVQLERLQIQLEQIKTTLATPPLLPPQPPCLPTPSGNESNCAPVTFPVPLPPGAVNCGSAPCIPFPPPLPPAKDCMNTIVGMFC